MKNYKMNKNRKELSDDDLREKMDFDRFIGDYKPVPFFRKMKFYVVLVATAGIIITGYYLTRDENEGLVSPKHLPATSFINPPIPGVDVPDTVYELNGTSDTILNYASGSSLHVPPMAFMDKNGRIVKGRIELHYRELRDIADFFISGIPMTYDSAGRTYHFESAGMMEISAFQNGEQLFASHDAPITISMASSTKGDRFNIYYLDTVGRKWSFVNKDIVTVSSESVSLPRPTGFSSPVKASVVRPRFDIAFDKIQFPELAVYEGVSFQISEDDKGYDPKLAMKDWDKVKIERQGDGIHYLVTFSNPGEEHVFKVQPVFSGEDYSRAKAIYEEKLKAYETAWRKGKSSTEARKRKLDSLYTTQYENMKTANDEARIGKRFNTEREAAVNLIFRQFTVSRFGVWNSDCPLSLPQGKMIIAHFMDGKKNKFEFDHVYLVEKGRRAMYSYYPDRFEKFSYNPKATNLIWAVTKDCKLALFMQEGFEKIKDDKDSSDFMMTVIEKKISSVMEVKKLFGI